MANCATGMVAGALTGAGILAGNVAALAELIQGPGEGAVAPILLVLSFALTFGMLAMGVSVMALSTAHGAVWGPLHRHYARMAAELPRGPVALEPTPREPQGSYKGKG